MRLLIDSCLSHRLAQRLADAGHDVAFVGEWAFDPGDPEILKQAFAQSRVLITLDKGFGRLAFEQRLPHAGIIRLHNINPLLYYESILRAIDVHGSDFRDGAMVVIGPSGMRKRRSVFDDDV